MPFPFKGMLGGIFHFVQILMDHLLANSRDHDQTSCVAI